MTPPGDKTLRLSDFSSSRIELNGNILVIDGKRYVNRGLWLIDDIDCKEQIVYKDDLGEDTWFAETLRFNQVELIPLFGERKKEQ